MNEYEKYYTENLYPLQDGILRIVRNTGTPFYLTGGTALSRHYYQVRYSDDLDLFVNSDPQFSRWVEIFWKEIESLQERLNCKINYNSVIRQNNYTQIIIEQQLKNRLLLLKIDLVNDVAPRYGRLENNKILGAVDSWRNILSNKISALFRFEAKDIVDLWILSKKNRFCWKEIIYEANTKEAGIDPAAILDILKSFPIGELDAVKWIKKIDFNVIMKDLHIIADDIFMGKDNSLAE